MNLTIIRFDGSLAEVRYNDQEPQLLRALVAAYSALRSFQYGNAATDYARDIADAIELALDEAELLE